MTGAGDVAGRDKAYAICGASKRQTEGACTRPAGWGTSHPGFGRCKLHGGSTQSGTAAAEAERQQQALEDAKRTFGLPVDVEPGEALLGLVRTSAGVVAWLGARVAILEAEKVTTVDHKTHALVALYLEERKHLAQLAKSALDAGIAERRVRLEEEQGRLLVGLLERIIRGLDEFVHARTGQRLLDPMDPQVREIVRVQLASIEGGAAA